MPPERFILATGERCDTITAPGEDFAINVHWLKSLNFQADAAQLQFYGDDHGQRLAFETTSWSVHQLELITAAISWYAGHIGHANMPLSIDPQSIGIQVIKKVS